MRIKSRNEYHTDYVVVIPFILDCLHYRMQKQFVFLSPIQDLGVTQVHSTVQKLKLILPSTLAFVHLCVLLDHELC